MAIALKSFEKKPVKIGVMSCARCGQDHDELEFKPCKRGPIPTATGLATHWATCPETGDPILMRIESN